MPVQVFVWFADQDRTQGRVLITHLLPMKHDGLIDIHTREEIKWKGGDDPVEYWVERAALIIVLLSKDFNSTFMDSPAMSRALERRRAQQVTLIPVVVRITNIVGVFERMVRLPLGGRAVSQFRDKDKVWTEIAAQIKGAVREWQEGMSEPLGEPHRTAIAAQIEGAARGGQEGMPEPMSEPHKEGKPSEPVLDPEGLSELYEKMHALQRREEDMRIQVREIQELIYREGRFASGDVLGRRFRLLAREESDDWLNGWSAWDEHARALVSLQLLSPALIRNERGRAEVYARAERAQNVSHSALCRIVRAGPIDDQHFLVTELPNGRTLDDMVVQQALPAHSVVGLIFHLGQGLAMLHQRRIIHGNVRPSSVRWVEGGGPRLGGWDPLVGVALNDSSRPRTTAYLAPELRDWPNWRELATVRSDIYGLAMLAVFAFYGAELGPAAVWSPESILGQLPCVPGLRNVLTKATSADPAQRHASVLEFCRELADAEWNDRDKLETVLVPGSTYSMGAAEDDPVARPQEKPAHEVKLDSFRLAKHPVSQQLYESVMAVNPSAGQHGAMLPVTHVSFLDAVEFCNRLSALAGLTPAYGFEQGAIIWARAADGYRLPTEAEWEYAARGTDSRLYPWGGEAPAAQLAWNGPNNKHGQGNRKGPAPLGQHPEGASPFDIEDMAGNVWEWCWDYYGAYPKKGKNPPGPDHSNPPPAFAPELVSPGRTYRSLRGGAWNIQDPLWLRASARSADDEVVRDPDIGFRVARNET